MFWVVMTVPLWLSASGPEPEVTLSEKKGSEFVSSIKVKVNAPFSEACLVLEKFFRQYKYQLDSLFDWALGDLKLRGEKDDMISIALKSHDCADGGARVNGVMDLYINALNKNFPATTYETDLTFERKGSDHAVVYYHLLRCDNVIDYVHANLTVARAEGNSSELTLNVRFKATLPYNLMSRKQYRDNIEWRLVRLTSNMRDEAERAC